MPIVHLPLISQEELVNEPFKLQLCKLAGPKFNYINGTGNKLTNTGELELANESIPTVTITEEDLADSAFNSNIHHTNSRYNVIADNSIGLWVKFFEVEKEFRITINHPFSTRGSAIWWRNSLLSNIRGGLSVATKDISITPSVPSKILNLIEDCRLLKVACGQEDRDFMEYLLGISANTLSMDTNSTRNAVSLNFPEQLDNVIISNPTEIPEPTLEDGKYTLEIELLVTSKIPSGILLGYPNFIAGTMLPDVYIDSTADVNTVDPTVDYNNGVPIDSLIGEEYKRKPDVRGYCYQVPVIESYEFPVAAWAVSPIFQVRVSASRDDLRSVVNLNDLFSNDIGGYKLDPDIKEYFLANKDIIADKHIGAVSVTLVKNGVPIRPDTVYVDDSLTLRSNYDLDILANYHILIGTVANLAKMDTSTFDTLREFPTLLNKLIKHTNPNVDYDALPKEDLVRLPVYTEVFNNINPLDSITRPIMANTLIVNTKYN